MCLVEVRLTFCSFTTRSHAIRLVLGYFEVYYNHKQLHSKRGYPRPETFNAKKSLRRVPLKSGQDHAS